jgi:hypothetical protein
VVHDLLPLAMRGVEHRRDRLLAVCVVARDVEELPRGPRPAGLSRWMRGVQVVPF